MKKLLFILFSAAGILNLSAGEALLNRAFETSAGCAIRAVMPNPVPQLEGEYQLVKYAPKLIFYRQMTDKGPEIRVETINVSGKKETAAETYIKNHEGVFGIANDGFAAEIIDSPTVWLPELLFAPLQAQDMALASYERRDSVSRNGRTCYKVVVSLPSTSAALEQLTGEPPEKITAKKKMYLAERPFRYEFLIDSQEYIIISRKHFNARGKVIFEMALESWENLDDDDDLFETPSGLKGKFLTQRNFEGRVMRAMLERKQPGIGFHLSNMLNGIIDWFCNYGHYVTITIAVIAIAGILIVKHSVNRAYKRSTHKAYKRR